MQSTQPARAGIRLHGTTALGFRTPRWARALRLRGPYARYRILRWQLHQLPSLLIVDITFESSDDATAYLCRCLASTSGVTFAEAVGLGAVVGAGVVRAGARYSR